MNADWMFIKKIENRETIGISLVNVNNITNYDTNNSSKSYKVNLYFGSKVMEAQTGMLSCLCMIRI